MQRYVINLIHCTCCGKSVLYIIKKSPWELRSFRDFFDHPVWRIYRRGVEVARCYHNTYRYVVCLYRGRRLRYAERRRSDSVEVVNNNHSHRSHRQDVRKKKKKTTLKKLARLMIIINVRRRDVPFCQGSSDGATYVVYAYRDGEGCPPVWTPRTPYPPSASYTCVWTHTRGAYVPVVVSQTAIFFFFLCFLIITKRLWAEK